jgi:hypothetical protein
MHRSLLLGVAAAALAVASAVPLAAQDERRDAGNWRLEGLRIGFCVQLLLDPASNTLQKLPKGHRPLPASEIADLHVSLRGIVEGQPELAAWSPSRLCFHAVDTIRTSEFTLGDRSGRRPQLFAIWTVTAADQGGAPREIALDLFVSSERLIRSGRLAGVVMREASLSVATVPLDDQNGAPLAEERFQVKVGKTTVTWDGRLVGDSVAVRGPIESAWTMASDRGGQATGQLVMSPTYSRAMAGALKVDGKDALAKALKASPSRFAGPGYRGGAGRVTFSR